MSRFLWGALSSTSLIVSLLFVRFWKESSDRLFGFFAAAFATLAVHWGALGMLNPSVETRHYTYWLRLLAFGLIIAGIIDKNRASGTRS